MADIKTPALGESVTEATVARWTKKPGDAVKKDEVLVELETDKVSLEVASPADGVLEAIRLPTRAFYIGVQWHPERTSDAHLGLGIIKKLILAAQK